MSGCPSVHACERNSLAGLVQFFTLSYLTEAGLVKIFRFEIFFYIFCIFLLFIHLCNRISDPVPSKDMQTLSPWEMTIFTQCWIEWKIVFHIFPIFIFLFMADCIYNFWWRTKCAINQKEKSCSKVAKFTGNMRNYFFIS